MVSPEQKGHFVLIQRLKFDEILHASRVPNLPSSWELILNCLSLCSDVLCDHDLELDFARAWHARGTWQFLKKSNDVFSIQWSSQRGHQILCAVNFQVNPRSTRLTS